VVGDYIPRVIIGSIDAGDHPEFVDRWGIRSLPTFLLFQNGDHHETVSGYRRAPELSALLDRLAAKRT
jgi:thioredoxin-like negative regulator of GroEL